MLAGWIKGKLKDVVFVFVFVSVFVSIFQFVFVSVKYVDFSDNLLKGVGRLDQRQAEGCCIDRQHSCRDETLQNSVYKHCPPSLHALQSEGGLKSTDTGNISEGIREIGLWEKFRGAIFGRDGVRKDRIVYPGEE